MNPVRRPVEAAYIPLARIVHEEELKLKEVENRLASARRACAKAMNETHVQSFSFKDKRGFWAQARLERPSGVRLSPRRLYTLLVNTEITLDTFLECVTIDDTAAKEWLTADIISIISETYDKSLDLVIEPI